MLRNKNHTLLFIFVFVISGCHEKRSATLLSQWKKSPVSNGFERKLASASRNQCVKDLYSVETLKGQIEEFENNYRDFPAIEGKWKHLDLASLPVPQANFLKKYGSEIGDRKNPNSIDYSGCQSVPCIFNRIYGKEDHVIGYVHYLWYLKFGNLLAADNMIPRQSSLNAGEYQQKPFALSEYLFKEAEIFGFWRLIMTLDTPYISLKFLNEIQRIPSGTWMEGNIPTNCGNAGNSGYILLMDGCLKNPETEMGTFYYKVPHELAHHVDYTEGSLMKPLRVFHSISPEYLELAQINRVEYRDKDNKTQIAYEPRPEAKFVSDYSKTSPAETFAETMAFFRFSGENTKKSITEDHYNYIRDKFYQGQVYTNEGHWERWSKKYSPLTSSKVFESIAECQKNQGSGESQFIKSIELNMEIESSLMSCLSRQAESIAEFVYGHVLISEAEGCVLMKWDTNRTAWKEKIKQMIMTSLNEGMTGLKTDPEFLKKIALVLNEETASVARNVFLKCQKNGAKAKECYEKSLSEAVGVSPKLSRVLLGTYRYEDQYKVVSEFYRMLIDSHSGPIKQHASNLWKSCKSFSPDDNTPPTGKYFRIESGYMVSSLYNCLNSGLPQTVDSIIEDIRYQGQSVIEGSEKKYIQQELNRSVSRELNQTFHKENEQEKKMAEDFVKNISQEEINAMKLSLKSFDWVSVGQVQSLCKSKVLEQIPVKIYFALKKDLFKSIVDRVSCQSLSSSPEFSAWTQKNRDALNTQVYDYLETRVLSKGESVVQRCWNEHAQKGLLDGVFGKSKLDKCIEAAWIPMEEEISQSVAKVDVAYRMKIPQENLLSYAQARRKAWIKKLKKD